MYTIEYKRLRMYRTVTTASPLYCTVNFPSRLQSRPT